MADDPLMFTLLLTEMKVLRTYVSSVMDEEGDPKIEKEGTISYKQTKTVTYRQLNPTLIVHLIYTSRNS